MTNRLHLSLAWLLLAASAPGQPTDGWVVVSSATTTVFPTATTPFPGTGGLWLHHPRNRDEVIPITGLGPDLTGAGQTGLVGASCVHVRPSDGALLVAEFPPVGETVDLHVITLNGTAVARDQRIPIGCGGGISQIDLLPDETVLLANAAVLTTGPMAGTVLGHVDPSTGVVTGIPTVDPLNSAVVSAVVADPSGDCVYLGTYDAPTQGAVWRLPVPGGGAGTQIAALPAGINDMEWDGQGRLLIGAGARTGFGPDLFRLDPVTGSVSTFSNTLGDHCALAFEPATGRIFGTGQSLIPRSRLVHTAVGAASARVLGIGPAGGWGLVTGLDVLPNPREYAAPAGNGAAYPWRIAPNRTGLPIIGNANFTLELDHPGIPGTASVAAAALGAQIPPLAIQGFALHLDPARVIATWPLTLTTPQAIPLPLPDDQALRGLQVFFQSLHLEPAGPASSVGLSMTVL
ncbi:MAG: hypothetical protein AAF628_14570 [Planctomycetota bacterium]